jgi:hypothetical protein
MHEGGGDLMAANQECVTCCRSLQQRLTLFSSFFWGGALPGNFDQMLASPFPRKAADGEK